MKNSAVAQLGAAAFSVFVLTAGAATATTKTIGWALPENWEDGVTCEMRDDGFFGLGGGALQGRYGMGRVGEPDLPTLTAYVELPAGGTFAGVELAAAEWVPVETEGRVPVPVAEWVRYGEKLVYPALESGAYGRVYPSEAVVAGAPVVCRGVTSVPVTVTPYRWDGPAKTLYKASRLEVSVAFAPGTGAVRRLSASASATADNPGQVIIISPSAFVRHWEGYAAFRKSTEAGRNFAYIVKNTADIYADARYWTKHCSAPQNEVRADSADALAIHHYIEDVYDPSKEQYVILGAAPTKSCGYDRATVVPARYVGLGNLVCDMYYGCMDRRDADGNVVAKAAVTADSPEVWDWDCDGYYMGSKNAGGGFDWDRDNRVDWGMDLPVTRVPMMAQYTEGSQTITADQIMDHFTNKIAFAENPATWTRDKRWRQVIGGGYLFNYYDRGSEDDLVQGECEFFDGGINHFRAEHKSPAPDAEACPRKRNYQYYTFHRAARPALINTGGFENATVSELYSGWGDLFNVQSHGLTRGAEPGRAQYVLSTYATGLWRVFNMALPCETGCYDNAGYTNCCSMAEAPFLSFHRLGGGLATFNNSRAGFWGGFNVASSLMEGLVNRAFYEQELNVGQACRWMHNECPYKSAGSNGGAVNVQVVVHGDPLVRISEQYSRTWNAANPNYTWSSSASGGRGWTVAGVGGDEPLDYSKDLWVNVSGKGDRTFSVEDEDMSAARLVLAGDKGQTITLGGAGAFRTTDYTVVTNAHLTWNVAGGAGRNGIAFVCDEPRDLTFEGNARRYVGYKVRNVRNLNVSGLNVTFDSDRNQVAANDFSVRQFGFVGSNDLSDGADGDYNVIRSRVQGYFPDTMTIPVVSNRLELQTYNIGGGDGKSRDKPLFYLTNAYLRVSYNPYWKSECFVRPTYLTDAHIVGAYAQFGFGRPGSDGYDLYVRGKSSITGDVPIRVTGELRIHLLDAQTELAIANPMTDGHGGAAGSVRILGSGTVRITAPQTFTGEIVVEDGARLELPVAKAVSCGVTVRRGGELHLGQLPLEGAGTVALEGGSRTYLGHPTGEGVYRMVDAASSRVEKASDALVYDADLPGTPLSGSVSEGCFLVADSLISWSGTSGTWRDSASDTDHWRDAGQEPTGFRNGRPVVFGVQPGADRATVTVSDEVRPGFVAFDNPNFPYTFTGPGLIALDALSSGYDVTYDASLSLGSILKVTGGTTTVGIACAPAVEVANGGTLHVADALTEPPRRIKAIRFTFSASASASEKTAIQEVRFFRDYAYFPLPKGTVLEDIAGQKIEIAEDEYSYEHQYRWIAGRPNNEEESIKALVDGMDYGKNNNKWWASTSSMPTWFTVTFPEAIDPLTGYSLCTADATGRNPKSWSVSVSFDGELFTPVAEVSDFGDSGANAWIGSQPFASGDVPGFDIGTVPGTLTVRTGGRLVLDGAAAHSLVLEAGATLAVSDTYDRALHSTAESAKIVFPYGEGAVSVDASRAVSSTTAFPILCGYNLAPEDLDKFRCVTPTAALEIRNGDLYIVTSGIQPSPYAATVAASGSAYWNALAWQSGSGATFTWDDSTKYRTDGTATLGFTAGPTTVSLNVGGALETLALAGPATDAVALKWGAAFAPQRIVLTNYLGAVALDPASYESSVADADIYAGTDTDIPFAGTGQLVIGAGKRAAVPTWGSYANVSGAGTLAIRRSAREESVDAATWANANRVTGTNELFCGTWEIRNTSDYPRDKEVRIGAKGLLKITTANDTTGYDSYATGLTLADGGEMNVDQRDTFNRTLTLENGGRLTFTRDASDNGRIFDFFSRAKVFVTGAATSVIGGSAAPADGLTGDPTVGSGIVAIRRSSGFTVDVADGSSLDVFAQWGGATGQPNPWVKAGGGLMSFYRASGQTGSLTISNGVVRLVNGGQGTTGAIVNQGELQVLASNGYEQAVGNAVSGAGRLVKLGFGTTVLSGANTYSGDTAVEAGTLALSGGGTLGAGRVTVGEGATLRLGTCRPSATLVTASKGTLELTLTADEKTRYEAGTLALSFACDGTAAGLFGGAVNVYDTDGATPLAAEADIVLDGGVYRLQVRRASEPFVPPYHGTVESDAGWMQLDWRDSSVPPRSVTYAGWDGAAGASLSFAGGAASVTVDRDLALETLVVTNVGTQLTVETNGICRLAVTRTIDDSASTGKTVIGFPTASAEVVAGAHTVVKAGGAGRLSVGANQAATVMDGVWTGAVMRAAASTLRYAGTAGAASVPDTTGDGNVGRVVYAADFGDLGGGSLQFANSLTRAFEAGFRIVVDRLVFGNQNNSVQTFTQDGGSVTVTGGAGPDSTSASTLFAHWHSTVTYAMNGGTFTAENAAVRLGWDGRAFVTVAGGTFRTKGICSGGSRNNPASFTLSGGTLELGDCGIQASGAAAAYTLAGGTVRAYTNTTLSVAHTDGLRVTGTVALDLAGFSVSVGKVTGGGRLAASGAGTLVLSGDASGFSGVLSVAPGTTVAVGDGSWLAGGKLAFADETCTLVIYDRAAYDGEIDLGLAAGSARPAVSVRSEAEAAHAFAPAVTGELPNLKVTYVPWVSGKAAIRAYEFDGNLSNSGSDGTGALGKDNGPYYRDGAEVFALTQPYSTLAQPMNWPESFTVAIHATLPDRQNACLMAWGTLGGGGIGLTTGDPARNEVKMVYWPSNTAYAVLATMSVPNAQRSKHLYVFTRTANTLKIYLDGSLVVDYVGAYTLGNGFQVGSVHGGIGSTGLGRLDQVYGTTSDTDACFSAINALRIYDAVLGPNALAQLVREFPYESPNGTYVRALSGSGNAWVSKDAWTKQSVPYDAPAADATVSLSAASDASVVMNVDAPVSYEAVNFSGGGTITVTAAEGAASRISCSGVVKVGTDAVVSCAAFDLGGTPIEIASGRTLTLDASAVDLAQCFESTTNTLTGVVAAEDVARQLRCVLPAPVAGRTAVFAKNESNNTYELRITVEKRRPFVFMIAKGGGGRVFLAGAKPTYLGRRRRRGGTTRTASRRSGSSASASAAAGRATGSLGQTLF